MMAASIATPDPTGEIHAARLDEADAPILALGRELEENRAAVEAESERADALQEANPDDAETRAAAWAIRDAYRPLTDRYHAILNELRDRPASTLVGMAVKATAILQWLSPGGEEIPGDHEDGRVAWSLARDVLRMAEAKGAAGGTLDAELISDCDEFTRRLKAANASTEDATAAEMAKWEILSDRIIAAPTRTEEGVLARVRALAAAHGDFGASFDYHEGEAAQMLAAIMHAVDPEVARSLASMAGGAT